MEEEELKQEVLKFTEALRSAGIRSVSVSYTGCGDEGRTEELQFEDDHGVPLEQPCVPTSVDLDTLAGLLAGFMPDGYQDGEGGWGTVRFNVQSQKIRVEHNWYETVATPTNRGRFEERWPTRLNTQRAALASSEASPRITCACTSGSMSRNP